MGWKKMKLHFLYTFGFTEIFVFPTYQDIQKQLQLYLLLVIFKNIIILIWAKWSLQRVTILKLCCCWKGVFKKYCGAQMLKNKTATLFLFWSLCCLLYFRRCFCPQGHLSPPQRNCSKIQLLQKAAINMYWVGNSEA